MNEEDSSDSASNASALHAKTRQELLELKESLIQGGMTPQQFVETLAVGNTKNSIDMMQLGRKRQEEIIRKMQKTKQLIEPKEYEDHVSYLAYLNQFVNKAEFRNMSPEDKALVIEHRKLREQMVGEQQSATPPAGAGAPPSGPMGGGMPPMGGGMPPMM